MVEKDNKNNENMFLAATLSQFRQYNLRFFYKSKIK